MKNLPGQMRHCGSLLSHERSHNPDKETRVRGGGVNDEEEEEVMGSLWPCAIMMNTCVLCLRGVVEGGVDSRETSSLGRTFSDCRSHPKDGG